MYLCINKLVSNHLTSFTYTSFIKALPDLTLTLDHTYALDVRFLSQLYFRQLRVSCVLM